MRPLETDRLILRELDEPDRAPLLEILGDPRVMEFSVHGPLDAAGVVRFTASLNVVRKLGFVLEHETRYQGWDVAIHRRTGAPRRSD